MTRPREPLQLVVGLDLHRDHPVPAPVRRTGDLALFVAGIQLGKTLVEVAAPDSVVPSFAPSIQARTDSRGPVGSVKGVSPLPMPPGPF